MKTNEMRDLPAQLLVRAAWGVALLAGAIALAVMASGCQSDAQSTSGGGEVAMSAPSATPVPEPPTESKIEVASVTGAPEEIVKTGTPAPEVAALGPDSTVTPGSVVEIVADASDDVQRITLRDDLGRELPFVKESGIWRASYRVPMRSSEHPSLSVTAVNGDQRWSRVWVFLNVGPHTTD